MYNITSRLPRYRTKHVVSWIFKNICYLLKRNCLKKRAVYPPTPKKAVTLERWGWGCGVGYVRTLKIDSKIGSKEQVGTTHPKYLPKFKSDYQVLTAPAPNWINK